MKRNKSLFLIIRQGSDLDYLEEVTLTENEFCGDKNTDKLKVLSKGYLTKKVAASRRNKFLALALHASRQRTLQDKGTSKENFPSVKPSLPRENTAEGIITEDRGKKMNIYQLSAPSPRKIFTQMNYASGYFVDEQNQVAKQQDSGETVRKNRKKSHFETKEATALQYKPKPVDNLQAKREVQEREFIEEFYKELAPKHQHLKSFQDPIKDAEKFCIAGKPVLLNKVKEYEPKVEEILSLPWFPTKKGFSRTKLFHNKLQIHSDFKRNSNESATLSIVVDSASDSNVSDQELQKSKLHLDNRKSNTKSTNPDSHLFKSRFHYTRRLNRQVNKIPKDAREGRSTVDARQIEIFLPSI